MSFRTNFTGRVDRSRPLTFTFDGRAYRGFAGDSLASALLANGVHLVGRSFKYHRPRGIFAAGSEEPNGLVTVFRDEARYTPNLRVTQVELYEGLRAVSQNRWPSLERDVGRVNDWLSAFFPAGFYYKTFMWPKSAWKKWYEPAIRRAAGLGLAPTKPDPDRYAQRYAHCDVLVVGGGPAGLAAALAAADSGARIMLCDESAEFGGSLLGDASARINGDAALDWVRRSVTELRRNARVTLLTRTTAFGYFPHNLIGLNERITDHLATPPRQLPRERLWQVRAHHVILATGAIERPLVFPGNDLPGIILAGAAQTYLNRYGVLVGRRVVVVTACDTAYQAALDLRANGVTVAAVADVRPQLPSGLPDAVRGAGIEVLAGATVLGTEGNRRVKAIILGEVDPAGRVSRTRRLRVRFGADVGRIHTERASVLAIARQARLGRVARGLHPGPLGGTRTFGGREPGHHRSRAGAGGRRERRRGGGRLVGRIRFAGGRRGSTLQRRSVHPARRRDPGGAPRRTARQQAQGLRGLSA